MERSLNATPRTVTNGYVSGSERVNCSNNDSSSTLSRTMTEEELASSLGIATQRSGETNTSRGLGNEEGSFRSRDLPSQPRRPRPLREKGPNEQLYMDRYHAFVKDRIASYRKAHALQEYASMSEDEKMREQQRVLELLDRLKITPTSDKDNSVEAAHENPCSIDESMSCCHDHDNDLCDNQDPSILLLSPEPAVCQKGSADQDEQMIEELPDQSAMLLSPDAAEHDISESSSCTSPLEKPRAVRFESPTNSLKLEKKRLASTSGKRGADTTRLRASDSPCQLEESIRGMSLGDDHIFTTSQSPISPAMTNSPIRDDHTQDISFGSHIDNQEDHDSLVETAMLPTGRIRWDFDGTLEKEAPMDVRLLDQKEFRFNTLPTKKILDPFRLYPKRLQGRLTRLRDWVSGRQKAIVLSIHEQELIDLVLSLQNRESVTSSNSGLHGNSLVVCRSKVDLESWCRVLRESSSLSVLNHATLPLRERKSPSGSSKAIHFDVVVTTFDALKSPDVTVTLDEQGFVQNDSTIVSSNGWHTRSSSATSMIPALPNSN